MSFAGRRERTATARKPASKTLKTPSCHQVLLPPLLIRAIKQIAECGIKKQKAKVKAKKMKTSKVAEGKFLPWPRSSPICCQGAKAVMKKEKYVDKIKTKTRPFPELMP